MLYRALTDAIEHTPPACLGDNRYTQNREYLSDDTQRDMSAKCATCRAFTHCDKYATAERPTGGYWAGRYYGKKER